MSPMLIGDWDREVAQLREDLEALKHELADIATPPSPLRVPSILEFVLNPGFLGKQLLYPRQATMLKSVFLQDETYTAYDRGVIDEWQEGFAVGAPDDLLGGWWFEPSGRTPDAQGTTPDLLDRVASHKQAQRRWFPQVNFVGGRRCGKGEFAAMAVSYVLFQLLALDEPQRAVHAARGKTLTVDVFAGNQAQARYNVFADIVRTLTSAPCFKPYIQDVLRDKLVLATPFDLRNAGDGPVRGTIEVIARETTVLAGRGQSSVIQIYDEMAWVTPGTSKAPAEELYGAATPALDQARNWSFILTISSPYQQFGMFYELNARSREIDPSTGRAMYPELISFQLPSWAPYLEWHVASELPLVDDLTATSSPWFRLDDGRIRTFPAIDGPVSVYDHELQQEERADPIRFRVERRAQWASVTEPYLNAVWIDQMWAGPGGERLERRQVGILSDDYVMHLDPSSKHDAYAVVIGHAVEHEGRRYAVLDHIDRWVPEDGELPVEEILDQIAVLVTQFHPSRVTVDQHGGQFVKGGLERRLRTYSSPKRTVIEVRAHTSKLNLETTTLFRDLMRTGQVRSYFDRQLDLELRFLQDRAGKVAAPTTGPVTTDDVADAAIVVAATLLDPISGEVNYRLSTSQLRGVPGLSADHPLAQQFAESIHRSGMGKRPGTGRTFLNQPRTRHRRGW